MQQHQGGGSPYGAPPPDMGPFSTPAASSAMPLSSKPPSSSQPQPQQQLRTSYEELAAVSGAGGAGGGGFPDDEMLGDAGGGSGGGSGASGGNRWPREETLALIRIRSEMDATFRDATLKRPLWEDVSRKLADLGYKRSAKKCKEKFENVHKYYKRTKEGRAGRQDGKSYRFFSELEALHAAGAAQQPQQQQLPPASSAPQLHAFAAPMNSFPPPPAGPMQPAPISSAAPAPAPALLELPPQQPLNLQGLSFSSMSDSESDGESDDDDDMTAETGGSQDRLGKRKRGGGSKKMMSFFEGLMQQIVERQEEMQRRFLETMEKREAERTAREEAWRRQEVARLNREQDHLAQERAAAASRDAAIIAFLQRIGGHSVQPPTAVVVPMPARVHVQTTPPPKKPPRQQHTPPPPQATPQPKPISASPLQQQPPQQQHKETSHHDATTSRSAPPTSAGSGASLELVPSASEQHVDSGLGGDGGAASSSRWPKAEVHALIQLRVELDMRYHDSGPKGPLWEEISAGMRRLGYNRSSKRCKEKWENINKYYKKVKESNKKRPEDSKTCPYFHQLEAIYRKKQLSGGAAASATNVIAAAAATPTFPDQLNQSRHEIEGKNINDDKMKNGGSGGGAQAPTSNGETSPPPTTAALDADSGTKKPEDIVRELTEQPPRELTTDETDSDDMGDEYTDDGEEGEDDGKMQYRIQFQRPNPGGANSAPVPSTTTAPAVPASAPTTTNTFAAMVQ